MEKPSDTNLALPGRGRSCDQGIGLMMAFDDGGVVVHLAGVDTRICLVFLHIQAFAHADEALALQTAPRFRTRLFRRIAACVHLRGSTRPHGATPSRGVCRRVAVAPSFSRDAVSDTPVIWRSIVMAARRPSAAHATGVLAPSGAGQPPKQTEGEVPASKRVTGSISSRAGAKSRRTAYVHKAGIGSFLKERSLQPPPRQRNAPSPQDFKFRFKDFQR